MADNIYRFPKVTAESVTNQQLRELFERHCECRGLDPAVEYDRPADQHSHDCDLDTCHDVQVALGIVLFNDIGRVQAMHQARQRCADLINDEHCAECGALMTYKEQRLQPRSSLGKICDRCAMGRCGP